MTSGSGGHAATGTGGGDATGTGGAGDNTGTGGSNNAGSGGARVTGTGGGNSGSGGGRVTGTGGGNVGSGGARATGTGGGSVGTGGRTGGSGGNAAGTGGATRGTGGTTAGTGGATAGTGGMTGSCTPPAAPALIGFAATGSGGTSGGGSANATTVTTLSALNSAAAGSNSAVIIVNGKLANGQIHIGSNKTIIGVCGAELHGHVEISNVSNVIIRNIKIVGYAVGNCALDPSYDSSVGCSSGDDAVSIHNNAHHIWLDHDDISDGTDGNLDITEGANNVTVSWTKFHYTARTDNSGSDSTGASGHRFSSLVGGSDSTTSDANALKVTWHHNWWADRVVERQPRVRFGQNHLFNNVWTSAGDNYCVRAGIQGQILLDDNVFTGVASPHEFNSTADQGTAYITATNNVYTSTTGTRATGGGGTPFTTPPYTYTPDATSGLQAAVQAGAGPQ